MTADLIINLMADAREITDAEIEAGRIAATTIERGDTVRYPGKRTNWIVGNTIDAHTVEVFTFCGHGARTYRSHTVVLSRLELVRKGNRTDDALAAMGVNPVA